jgi:hypothetical protein
MKVSELARELRPYLIQIIREIVGDMEYDTATLAGDLTWIHGTGFPQKDSIGNRGLNAVDLQLARNDDSDTAQATNSAILGGYKNQVESQATGGVVLGGQDNLVGDGSTEGSYAVAFGQGAIADNDFQLSGGALNSVRGDSQWSVLNIGHATLTADNTWQDIAEFTIRADTTWAFRALVAGIRQGAAESFGYEIVGVLENDGGTTSLLASTVTTLYEDDVSYNCQAVASDANDSLVIQITDTDNSGNQSRWHTTVFTSEVSWAA